MLNKLSYSLFFAFLLFFLFVSSIFANFVNAQVANCSGQPDGTPCLYQGSSGTYYGGANYCCPNNGNDVCNILYACQGGSCTFPASGAEEDHQACINGCTSGTCNTAPTPSPSQAPTPTPYCPQGQDCVGPDICSADGVHFGKDCNTGGIDANGQCVKAWTSTGQCNGNDVCDTSVNQCVPPKNNGPQCNCQNVLQSCLTADNQAGQMYCSGTKDANGICQASTDASCSTNCGQCVPINSSTPVPPSQTSPGPTSSSPPPAQGCNVSCVNPGDCLRANDGCTFCNVDHTCQVPPGPPPSGPPPQCNTPCSQLSDCLRAGDGCTFCGINNTCQIPPSPSPLPPSGPTGPTGPTGPRHPPSPSPSPSPKPQPKCTCDGIQITPPSAGIFPGFDVSFTATGIVKNNPSIGFVKDFTFRMTKGNDPNRQAIVAGPATIQATPIKNTNNRYSATWTAHVPADIPTDTRINAFVQDPLGCGSRLASLDVLGTQTSTPPSGNIFQRAWKFVLGIFGRQTNPSSKTATVTPSVAPTSQPASFDVSTPDPKELQLKTIYPAVLDGVVVDDNSCNFYFHLPKH